MPFMTWRRARTRLFLSFFFSFQFGKIAAASIVRTFIFSKNQYEYSKEKYCLKKPVFFFYEDHVNMRLVNV